MYNCNASLYFSGAVASELNHASLIWGNIDIIVMRYCIYSGFYFLYSRAFQRFAVRTSKLVEEMSSKGSMLCLP